MKLDLRSFWIGASAAAFVAAGIVLLDATRTPAPVPGGGDAARESAGGAGAGGAKDAPELPRDAESSTRERATAAGRRTPSELRRDLSTATGRLDQFQAIAALLDDGSPEAKQALLDAFLNSDDKVLLSLLEEALLRSPHEMAPSLMAAFESASDPLKLGTLAKLLRQASVNRPELNDPVVAFLVRALDDPGDARGEAAAGALRLLGTGAADPLAKRLAEKTCTPETAGMVAEVLSKLPPEHGDVLREKVTQGIDSTRDVLSDSTASTEDKVVARKKTGSLAWAASLRAPEEQDSLAPMLADQIGRTLDSAQAGTLAWGIGQMRGLSDTGRTEAARVLLDGLSQQRDGGIRSIIGRSIVDLVRSGAPGASDSIRKLVSTAEAAAPDERVRAQLRQMLEGLDAAPPTGK